MVLRNGFLSKQTGRWFRAALLCVAGYGSSAQAQQPAIPQPALFAAEPQVIAEGEYSTIPHPAESQASVEFASKSTATATEFRLRELEQEIADQKIKFASLAEEMKAADKKEAPKGSVVGSDLKMSGGWKDGAALETADKAFKMKWRGRTQLDLSGFSDGSNEFFQGLTGNQGSTAIDFRRLRIGTEGTLYDQFDFAVELDFVNSFNTNGSTNAFANNNNLKNAFDRQVFNIVVPTDVWIGMHEVPFVGNVRVGNVKPCNGLEHSNSSRFLDFMERSLNQDAFVGRFNNGFQPGVLFYNWNEDQTVTWANSITANTYNGFAYEVGGPDFANRLTWTPIYDEESHGRYLLHLGISATGRRTVGGQERIRARGSLRNGISGTWSNDADTTIFYSTSEQLLIPEIAAVYGSWHFQAEYFGQWNQDVRTQIPGSAALNPGPNLGTAYFQGYYGQVSYFLTGEHREYERKAGAFGRVVPYENFHFIKNGRGGNILTKGAWQVLYRYSLLDLNDPRLTNVNGPTNAQGVGGGTVYDHTVGLNHFINPNMKIQYNFVVAERSASAASPAGVQPNGAAGLPQVGGTSYGAGVRFAIDF